MKLSGMLRRLDRPATRAVIKGVVSVALLAWLARNVDGASLWARATTTDWRLVGLALLIQILLPVLVAERWRAICRRLYPVIPAWRPPENVSHGPLLLQPPPAADRGEA